LEEKEYSLYMIEKEVVCGKYGELKY